MPLAVRRWYIDRTVKELEEENKKKKAAMRKR